jgi:hypothetical protein
VGYGDSLTNIANIIAYTVHDFRHWFDLPHKLRKAAIGESNSALLHETT